ncbi:thermonuclease family protein [Salinicoccus kekensis]|uniref:Endonuclease YncB( thermonuclease family) n=1 Tax=Salinicoccus kekensis TaxID=714307 RepID=A0A285UCE9_9STAP|nr:thermonuclease family protein [Salinicoccus kekensis]SOC39413.1 endonuclease YncB(thermonuclease family) [Salinicoccus kekensis]
MRQNRKFDVSALDNKRNRRMIKKLGWPGLVLIIVIAGITYLFSGTENDGEEYTLGVFHEVTVDQFIDGDTTRFNFNGSSESFRYLIIDTPEVRTNSGRPEPYAVEASERVRELLTEADTVEVEFDVGPLTDDYDRYLAYIYADGKMVNEILVREGLAEVRYVHPPNMSHLERLEEAEAAAQEENAGMWAE